MLASTIAHLEHHDFLLSFQSNSLLCLCLGRSVCHQFVFRPTSSYILLWYGIIFFPFFLDVREIIFLLYISGKWKSDKCNSALLLPAFTTGVTSETWKPPPMRCADAAADTKPPIRRRCRYSRAREIQCNLPHFPISPSKYMFSREFLISIESISKSFSRKFNLEKLTRITPL